MKKPLILIGLFLLISCSSSNECLKSYLKKEIYKNKNSRIESMLMDEQLATLKILSIYKGVKIHTMDSKAKSFDQKDYDILYNKYKGDSIKQKWTKKDSRSFGFKEIIGAKEIKNYSINEDFLTFQSKNYFYSTSNPIYINKSRALFWVIKFKPLNQIIESYVIIMKKEKKNWIFVERVEDQTFY